MKILKKPYVFAILYSIFLLSLSLFIILDVFVIPRKLSGINNENGMVSAEETFSFLEKEPVSKNDGEEIENDGSYQIITDTGYEDENIKITINTVRIHDTQVYVADVILSSSEYFKTAIAKNTFGTNICEKTSTMAENNGAILAINGDYYGASKKGYVIKNGILYRDSVRADTEYDDLAVMYDGSFEKINEEDIDTDSLLSTGVYQLFGFGPFLVEDSEVVVDLKDEVGQAMSSNPRTAIGVIDTLHYIFVVSDGRTSESEGLSLYELAEFMKDQGCKTAYNLDGGGSSTMYFNGKVINNPVQMKNKIKEREVSDIVFIGY